MEKLAGDVKFAVRMLAKRPWQSLVAIVTVAVGIAASAALFSVVNSVVLAPLPYPESDRLVVVWGNHPNVGDEVASPPDYADWRAQSRSFESMGAFAYQSMNVAGIGEPERVVAARADTGFFAAMKLAPELGRIYDASEDVPNGPSVVLLGDGFWRRAFGADPSAIGRTIELNGRSATIVGVMPPELELKPLNPSVYVPLQLDPQPQQRRSDNLHVVGRLQANTSLEAAESEMKGIALRLEQLYPNTNERWTVRLEGLQEAAVKDVRPLLFILLAAVLGVLAIACANVANLLLARASTRQREMAIRAALGAGRGRLAAQFVTEGMILSAVGSAVGLLAAPWVASALVKLSPAQLSLVEGHVDYRLALFCVAASVLTGLVFGLVPSLQIGAPKLQEALKASGRSLAGDERQWLQRGLVAVQVGLALVLLVGVGLLVRSFGNLLRVDPGFDAEGLTMAAVTLPAQVYDAPAKCIAFATTVRERVATLPGVDGAAVTTAPPIVGGGPWLSFTELGVADRGDGPSDANVRSVSDGYFSAMRIPLRAGRAFEATDTESSPKVAVVNEAMVRQFWPNESPIGKQIAFGSTDAGPTWREIVGIVGDVRHEGPDEEEVRAVYLPYTQRTPSTLFLVVRTTGDPNALGATIRREIAAIDPSIPPYAIGSMDKRLSDALAPRRFAMSLVAAFGLVALFLAAIGIYAVTAYLVSQRTREIGVRMALGATRRNVVAYVLRRGAALAAAGLVLGVVASIALSRFMGGLLYGVSPTDPIAILLAAAVLGAVALAATLVPARRASRVDPMVALRYE